MNRTIETTPSPHSEVVNPETLGTPQLPATPLTPSTPSAKSRQHYTPERANALLTLLATTQHSLPEICRQPGMPHVNTVYRWKKAHPHFAQKLQEAREQQAALYGRTKAYTRYTPQMGAAFCEALGTMGANISEICRQPGMPHAVTINKWLKKYPPLRAAYERALAIAPPRVEYSEALADKICEQIATTTKGLHEVCKSLGGPHIATVFKWLRQHAYFREQYHLAKEVQANLMIEQILHIADDNDYTIPVAHLRLRIRVRQWVAGRLNPAKWGTTRQEKAPVADRREMHLEPAQQKPEWLTMKIGGREPGKC